MLTLSIESSVSRASAAVVDSHGTLDAVEYHAGRGSSPEPLTNFLVASLQKFAKPQNIVVGLGPGSYSGVRIAIATALGLALATRAKLFGLPSVIGIRTTSTRFRVVGDARRDSVYHALVEGACCLTGPELLEKAQLLELLERSPELPVFTTDRLPWLQHAQSATPDAARLAEIFQHPDAQPVSGDHGLEPLYLRPPNITVPAHSKSQTLAKKDTPPNL